METGKHLSLAIIYPLYQILVKFDMLAKVRNLITFIKGHSS
jgi:hypothetical protein